MPDYLLSRITLSDPQHPMNGQRVDVRIEAGRIADIQPAGTIPLTDKYQIITGDTLHVSPGWVDMHTVLQDPGGEHKETLAELAHAAVSGGFTDLVCHPHTHPAADNGQLIHAFRHRAADLPVRMWFCGTLSAGDTGKEMAELYDMHQAGAVGFTDDVHPVQSSGLLIRSLQYLASFDGLFFHVPYDASVVQDGQMNDGPQATLLGMKGIPELSESLALARMQEILQYTPGRVHLQPVSSPAALKHIRTLKAAFPQVTTGIQVAHLVLTDAALIDFDTHLKVFPPLRSPEQREQLREALAAGLLDVICTGHTAQGLEEKEVEFGLAAPGMLGLQTFFPLIVTHLIQPGIITLDQFVRMVAIRPREILRQPAVTLEPGSVAHLTLFDPDASSVLSAHQIPSRARNSPWINQPLTGKIHGVFCQGVFRQG
ncbi:MAG: dihydroorotase [Bacteroidia bacterium]|nr:dihydroorotase [Bacteroidia bacterium]